MAKKIYYGAWSAGDTFTAKPYEDTSKSKLIKLMTKMAYGNVHGMEACHWSVWYIDDDNNKMLVAEGGKGYGGRKWRENYER